MELKADELDPFLNTIHYAARGPFAQLAVVSSLTLPDICVSLADPADSRKDRGKRYMAWCKQNLSELFPYLTPSDIWSLRCGVSHSGRMGDATNSFGRYLLTLSGNHMMSSCVINDAYTESVTVFCDKFCFAAKSWLDTHRQLEPIRTNLRRLVRVHGDGVRPYLFGIPVLG